MTETKEQLKLKIDLQNDTDDLRPISVVDLITSGLHTNETAYALANTLISLHRQIEAIAETAKHGMDNEVGNRTLQATCIKDWMDRMSNEIEEVHAKTIAIDHYKNK